MKQGITLLALVCCNYVCAQYAVKTAQSTDFHSAFEETVLKAPPPKTPSDQIRLLLAASPDNNEHDYRYIEVELRQVYRDLEKEKVDRKSTSKAAEIIASYLRKKFFKQYNEYAGFEQLFKNANYNTATASALYALVLQHFDLPFYIQMEPQNIFPIVDPDRTPIALNTESPSQLKKKRKSKFAKDYVQLLRELRLLTGKETASEESLFYQYYAPKEAQISLNQLGGILYYQQALKEYHDKKYLPALQLIDKAHALFPLPRHETFRYTCLFQLAKSKDIIYTGDATGIFRLYEQYPLPAVSKEIVSSFYRLTDYQLHEKNQPEKLAGIYQMYLRNLSKETSMTEQIREIYFTQLARFYARKNETIKVLECMDSINHDYQRNKKVQDALAGLLIESISDQRDFEQGLDGLDSYIKQYPFLRNHPFLQDRNLFYNAERIRHYFDMEDEAKGLKYLNDFEQLLAIYGHLPKAGLWVTTAYTSASYYYFRAKDYYNARVMIQRGLALQPDDPYLKNQLELLWNY
ncbi:MAG: hypothetical protein DHS20C18_30060 [Saprospiraceae bacterium]|nr:MAG: hypothetical protein DHS20C18_30060 [Saprospiraceae bacterium]